MKPLAQLILCGASALLLAAPAAAQTPSEKKSDTPATSPSGSSSSGGSSASTGTSAARGKVQVQQQGQTRRQYFDKMDTNGDGSISRAEAQASPALVLVFPAADTNSDGMISVVEFGLVPLDNPDGTPVQ